MIELLQYLNLTNLAGKLERHCEHLVAYTLHSKSDPV